MNLCKTTIIAMLTAITVSPVISMNDEKPRKTSSLEIQDDDKFLHEIDKLATAQNEMSAREAAKAAHEKLMLIEEQVQAHLVHFRSGEQGAYNERAYDKGFDYTRLYQYQEGYHEHRNISPSTALGKHHNSPLHETIQPWENLLKEIHALMSLIEKLEATVTSKTTDKTNHPTKLKNEDKTRVISVLKSEIEIAYKKYMQNPLLLELMNTEKDMAEGIGSNVFAPSLCPDRFVIGKKVTTLFPHFSMDNWNQADKSRNVRTGQTKEPIAQIRLQGKLWDVFAHQKGETTTGPHPVWDHTNMRMIPHPDDKTMEFLDEKNKSKICIYKFKVDGGHGPLPGQPYMWGPLRTTYSIQLIPAKNQKPESRDKSYDEVTVGTEEEIHGERLNVADKTNPKESRKVVTEEMRQRLGRREFEENRSRRLHRRDIPMEQEHSGYLMPSDIKDQTYGRVHVPDHRYGRAYERVHNFTHATTANQDQMIDADLKKQHWEESSQHALHPRRGKEKGSEGIAGGRGTYSDYYHSRGLDQAENQNKNFNYQAKEDDSNSMALEQEKK